MKEKIETPQKQEDKQTEPRATNMELALFYASHIDNPCAVEVKPGEFRNIREFYLREARRALLTMQEPNAKRFLELKIKEYEDTK